MDETTPSSKLEVRTTKQKLEDFLFHCYKDQLYTFYEKYPSQKRVIIDYLHLERYLPDVADNIILTPENHIKAIIKVISDLNTTTKRINESRIEIGIDNFERNHIPTIRNIRSDYIGQLIRFDGIVKRKGEIIPYIKEGVYECRGCMRLYNITNKIGEPAKEPSLCQECGGKNFQILEAESKFEDTQILVIQEPIENVQGREQPREMTVILEGCMVDTILPGELVRTTGILKTRKKLKTKNYSYYVKANHITKLAKDYEDIEITPEDEAEIQLLSKQPDIFHKLTKSIAPSIKGHQIVKEALVLQLMGGKEKLLPDGSRRRNMIHILMVGDPGCGKSELLKNIARISPSGIYTSGKGSSSAGLTAAVMKDENGSWNLEAGALVLGDKGLVCVDEFDKMRSEDRAALHEALEQGTVSIAKAGIIATLNARCSILAAANPKFGRFDKYKGIGEQINLPSTILSRFDIIYPIEDIPNPENDSEMAWYILGMHEDNTVDYEIDFDMIKMYIAYARQNIQPIVKGEAQKRLHDFYLEMRGLVKDKDDPIPITARQLEGLVRLTEASAMAHLRSEAIVDDAERAIRIVTDNLNRIGYDMATGKIDIDQVEGRLTHSDRDDINRTVNIIDDMIEEYGKLPKKSLIAEEVMVQLGYTEVKCKRLVEHALKELKN